MALTRFRLCRLKTLGWLAVGCVAGSRLVAADCNGNEFDDVSDIAEARSVDCNSNGLPDECEGFPVQLGFRDEGVELAEVPLQILVADFNGDGAADVLAGSRSATESTFFLIPGQAGGGFSAPRGQAAPAGLNAFAVEDLDGDLDLDVAVANDDSLAVLRNDGTGGFAVESVAATPADARALAVADLSGDGRPDIAVVEADANRVSVHEGRTDGTFVQTLVLATEDLPVSIAAADLDLDGDTDIVVANRNSRTISLLRNLGGGAFADAESYPIERRPREVRIVDLNLDSAPDLLVVGFLQTLTLLINDGTGTFAELTSFPDRINAVFSGDLDGDGDVDIAATTSAVEPIIVIVQQQPLRFARSTEIELRWAARALAGGDLDDDGDADLVVVDVNNRKLRTLWNNEPGTLAFASTKLNPGGRPHSIALGDLNADGVPDIVTSNGGDRTVSILLNDGRGALELEDTRWFEQGGHFNWITAGAFDRDEHCDFVIADLGGKLQFFWGKGNGLIPDPVTRPMDVTPLRVISGDLNGDGLLDLVTTNFDQNSISRILNLGDRSFSDPVTTAARTGPVAAAPADFDGNRALDVAVANRSAGSVSLYLNPGNGDLALGNELPVDPLPTFLVASDLDGDGRPDLVIANEVTTHVAVLRNLGGARFSSPTRYSTGSEPWSIVVADLDGGGIADIITANERSGTLSVLQGLGDATFRPASLHNVGAGVRFLAASDMDRDGDVDLVAGNRQDASVSLLRNESGATDFGGDFLERICTALDLHAVAALSGSTRLARFLLPSDPLDSRPALFQNTRRFTRQEDFLVAAFPEVYADLNPQQYARLVDLRESREYFAGTLRQSHDDGVQYGFSISVAAGDTSERLGVTEVRAVFETLSQKMLLRPLVYAPSSAEAIADAEAWSDPGFPVVFPTGSPEPMPEPPASHPTFTLEVPADTVLCGVSFESSATRGLLDEYELKSTLRLRAGTLRLPTDTETFEGELFDEVTFGVNRSVLQAAGPGAFRRIRSGNAEGITTYRFTYSQLYDLPDGAPLAVELVAPLALLARGDEPLEPVSTLPDATFVTLKGRESFQASREGRPLVRYGSCTYDALPRWEIRALLADGVSLSLEERFEPATSLFETGPASLTFAEIRSVGNDAQTQKTEDYFLLVDSAARHNTRVEYGIFLETPFTLPSADAAVRAIELHTPSPPDRLEATAFYRDADLEIVAEVPVEEYSRTRIDAVVFQRADTNADGTLNLLDAIILLDALFAGAMPPPCAKAADANDDGRVNVADAVVIVSVLFDRGALPPEPFGMCGGDPTPDRLRCEAFAACDGRTE